MDRISSSQLIGHKWHLPVACGPNRQSQVQYPSSSLFVFVFSICNAVTVGNFCGRLSSLFRQQLLHNGFLNLTVPDENTSGPDIDTAISEFSLVEELSDCDQLDEVCCWWARVGQMACYLVKKDTSQLKDGIAKLQAMPARLSGR